MLAVVAMTLMVTTNVGGNDGGDNAEVVLVVVMVVVVMSMMVMVIVMLVIGKTLVTVMNVVLIYGDDNGIDGDNGSGNDSNSKKYHFQMWEMCFFLTKSILQNLFS